jgi:hypothetical protein
MSPAIASFVSAISVMLGAYGFFYNAYKGQIEDGLDVEGTAANDVAKRRDIKTVTRARNAARLLALIPLVVFALLVPQLEDQFGGSLALSDYSTLDVLFVVLSFGWLVIALVVGVQWRRLATKLRGLPKPAS